MKESKITLEDIFKEIDDSREKKYFLTKEEVEVVRYGRKEVGGLRLCSFRKISILIGSLTGKTLDSEKLNKHWLRNESYYETLYPVKDEK